MPTTIINAQPKNIVKSTTLWGGAIMFLSALAPFLSSLLGVDITADDINTGVSKVADAVQAVMGVVGFAVVIIGRFKRTVQPVTFGSENKTVSVTVPKATT